MPIASWHNMTDFGDLPTMANITSGGTFWIGMLHMIWVIVFLLLIRYGFEVALIVSSFLAMILALMLVYAGLITWIYVVQFAAIVLFMFLYIVWSGKKRR